MVLLNDRVPLGAAFALLTKAAARKRIYVARARQAGRQAEARLLAALAASEEAQARRLFNNYRGPVDTSERYLATIFTEEVAEVVAEYENQLRLAQGNSNTALLQALSQLRRAENWLHSFYQEGNGQAQLAGAEHYYVCPFCGYLAADMAPPQCPICGAAGESFREAL